MVEDFDVSLFLSSLCCFCGVSVEMTKYTWIIKKPIFTKVVHISPSNIALVARVPVKDPLVLHQFHG